MGQLWVTFTLQHIVNLCLDILDLVIFVMHMCFVCNFSSGIMGFVCFV